MSDTTPSADGTSLAQLIGMGIGVVLFVLSAYSFLQSYLLKYKGTTAQAVVTETNLVHRKGGVVYNVDYAFDLNHRHFTGTGDVSAAIYYTLNPGSPLMIRYVPANPSISETAEMSHSNSGLFLSLVIGFPVSFFIFVASYKKDIAAPGDVSPHVITPPKTESDMPAGMRVQLPPAIRGIAFTVYPVLNMERARTFYESHLGLTPSRNLRNEWIEYHLWDSCFAITTMMGDHGQPSSTGGKVAFEVNDVDHFIGELKKKGIRIQTEPFSTPVCRMAIVLDTEGNALTLHQKKTTA